MTDKLSRPPMTSPRRVSDQRIDTLVPASETVLQPWGNAAAGRGASVSQERSAEEEALVEAARPIPNQDAIYEHFARLGPMGSVDPDQLQAWGYRRGPVLARPHAGLHAAVFLPTPGAAAPSTPRGHQLLEMHGAPLRPVLVFGGRTAGNRDVDESDALGMGSYQFASCKADIVAALRGARSRVDVVGQGLGGVLAQLAAAHQPQAIGRVVTFQSAAVDSLDAEEVERWNRAVPGHQAVHSAHHRSGAQLPSLPGEQHTPGDAWTWGYGPGQPGDSAPPLASLLSLRGAVVPGLSQAAADRRGPVSLEHRVVGERPADLGARPPVVARGGGLDRGQAGSAGAGPHLHLRGRALALASSPAVSFRQVLALIEATPGVGPREKASLQEEVRKLIIERSGSGSGGT